MGNVQVGLAEDLNSMVCVDLRVVLYIYRRDQRGRGHWTWIDRSTLDFGSELLPGHTVPSLNLIPTSCDFHLLKSFIMIFFASRLCRVAMHYCNHTGHDVCRLWLLCIVFLWTEMIVCIAQSEHRHTQGFQL